MGFVFIVMKLARLVIGQWAMFKIISVMCAQRLRGNSTNFTHQSMFMGVKKFCSSSGSCIKSDNLPHVMSLETALVWAEDYMLENLRCGVKKQ